MKLHNLWIHFRISGFGDVPKGFTLDIFLFDTWEIPRLYFREPNLKVDWEWDLRFGPCSLTYGLLNLGS